MKWPLILLVSLSLAAACVVEDKPVGAGGTAGTGATGGDPTDECGGCTGDTLGAVQQLTEMAFLFALVVCR